MNDRKAKKIEFSEPLLLMLEAFFENCDPEIEWHFSEPYREGDHPVGGGGRIQVDIERAELTGAGCLSRSDCLELFGKRFVDEAESYACKNFEQYCDEDIQ